MSWTARVAAANDGTVRYLTPVAGHPPLTFITFPSEDAKLRWIAGMPGLYAVTGNRWILWGGPVKWLDDVERETEGRWAHPRPDPHN